MTSSHCLRIYGWWACSETPFAIRESASTDAEAGTAPGLHLHSVISVHFVATTLFFTKKPLNKSGLIVVAELTLTVRSGPVQDLEVCAQSRTRIIE